jgi:RND family efflux transporter MFP subunit
MSRRGLLTIAVAVLLILGIVTLVMLRKGSGDAADAEAHPIAVVTLATVRRETVQDVVSVYGTVQADPASSLTVAAPKAAIVSRMLVRSGETVAAGQSLVELANSPASEMVYQQAAGAAASARADLARVQRLLDERLAANDQLIAAKKSLSDAQATLSAQEKQGGGQLLLTLKAPHAGVVTAVSAAGGDHVAQDAALVVLAGADGGVAKLGLEPFGRFAVGQVVTLKPVYGSAAIASRLTMIGRAADQTTKTLDATAPLNGARLPIGAAVQGDVVIASHVGMLAPRAAVVFDETGPHVFVFAGGKAERVFVKVGLNHGDDIEISGDIPVGAQVVVEGAYELQDGMPVKARAR